MKNKTSLLFSLFVVLLYRVTPCLCQELSGKVKDLLEREQENEDTIRFFGKIIDQHGQPIEGAIVTAHIWRPHIVPQGPQVEQASSDARGLFQIPSEEGHIIRGCGLYVSDIQKEGYEIRFDWDAEGHQGAEYQKNSAQRHNPDKAKPVVFHMRKKNSISTFLIQNPYLELHIDASESGSTLEYDFLQKKKAKSRMATETKDGSQFGDLRMKATINTNDMSWAVVLSLVGTGGGILATNQFLYEAPQDGYRTEYRFSTHDQKTPEATIFYIRSRSQTAYTRLVIKDIKANPGSFRMSANIETNPYGDRNLEPATGLPFDVVKRLKDDIKSALKQGKHPPKPDLQALINEHKKKEKSENNKQR